MNVFKRIVRIFSYVIILLGIGGLTLCAMHSDKLDITTYNYQNSKIIDNNSGFKATIFSDYHHRELKFANTNIIDEINNLEHQDAIFFIGDLIDTHTKSLDDINKIFKACKSKATKMYFVTGNHEEYAPLFNELKVSLKENEVDWIDNKCDKTTFENKNVHIYGLEDPRFATYSYKDGKKDYGRSKEYLDKFKEEFDPTKINILLSHRPELVDLCSQYNYDYVFSGHSHGGQIKIGNLTPLNLLYGKDNYARGKYKVNNTELCVGAGLGYSALFPIRVNCNPEIVKININK